MSSFLPNDSKKKSFEEIYFCKKNLKKNNPGNPPIAIDFLRCNNKLFVFELANPNSYLPSSVLLKAAVEKTQLKYTLYYISR